MAKHIATNCHAYNRGLSICNKALENQEKLPSAIDLYQESF